jgi:predicted Rdx family selenoprotein
MRDVRIFYCPVWSGYDRRAASLAAEITEQTGRAATAVAGKRSQFDVYDGDTLIFSKQGEGRYPEPAEIIAKL